MIQRYTREKMGEIWSPQNRFEQMLKVEKAVALIESQHNMIPKKAGAVIQKKGKFSLKAIQRLEKKTKHDVSAFVQNVSQNVGPPYGAYVHYGLTSSDVLDTALSLQILSAHTLIQKEISQLKSTLKALIQKHKKTLLAGRTHGIHAETSTFGFKLLGFLNELLRAEQDLSRAVQNGTRGMISGPVGTCSALSPSLEKEICKTLGLKPEPVSTQVIPRDRHARILFALCLILTALERWAVELRHLQRTEVGEVSEGFSKHQQGSSSMPHKKNPISSENITGLSRLLKSFLQAGLENITLWHERDISHSSVERVIFPDAFILCDYALHRMQEVFQNLQVHETRMKQNLLLSGGGVFSSEVLLALVQKGVDRQTAYLWVQKASHAKNPSTEKKMDESSKKMKKKSEDFPLFHALQKNPSVKKHLSLKELKNIFSGEKASQRIARLVETRLKELKL